MRRQYDSSCITKKCLPPVRETILVVEVPELHRRATASLLIALLLLWKSLTYSGLHWQKYWNFCLQTLQLPEYFPGLTRKYLNTWVALAVCFASSFTSLATTVNPRPASPVLADSMVAFEASECDTADVVFLFCTASVTSEANFITDVISPFKPKIGLYVA
jgi:hypothetical protein